VFSNAKVILLGLMTAVISLDEMAAAEIKPNAAKDGRLSISITGEILPGDAEAFSQVVKQANDAGKFVANIRLNSDGGNLLEGVKLADAVRFGKMSTNVGKTATCASACFLVFAAGATKFVSYGAQIGVHGASDETGRETVSSEAATVSMAKVAKDLGVPPAIIGRMVVTPPNDMVWLSPDELQSMGATMVGKPAQTAQGNSAPSIGSGQFARQTPQQTAPPSDPIDLSPTAKSSSGPATWESVVDKSVELSAQQNGGKPRYIRSCQPENKTCFNAVMFNLKGAETIAKITRDMNDRVIRRELCSFNASGDIRICLDWDTKRGHRDMQDSNGNWSKIADE
jgi:hypothetical protein